MDQHAAGSRRSRAPNVPPHRHQQTLLPKVHLHKPPYLNRQARPVSPPWLLPSWPSCKACCPWWSWLMVAASSEASSKCMLLCVGRKGIWANECLRSVSKRTTKQFRTKLAAADRRSHKRHARPQNGGCAGVSPWRAKGQDQRRGGRPCLMMQQRTPEGKCKTHTHHETRHRRRTI